MGSSLRWLCAVAAVAAVVVAGCSNDDNSGTSGDGAVDVVTTTPAASGEARQVVWNNASGEPTKLDPNSAPSAVEWNVLSNLCESPMILHDDGTVEPGLADKVELTSPTEISIHVRDGATFWNGDRVTAEDVAWSIERARDPELSLVAFFFGNVKTVRATGPEDVKITLSKPDALFFRLLATSTATVQQRRFVESQGDKYGTPAGGLMCTGPFKLDRWNRGRSIEISRNDSWWNKDAMPKTEKLEFRFIKDEATLTSALLSGEIQGTYNAPLSGVARLRSASDGKLFIGESPYTFMLLPLNPDSLLNDPKVREAIALSIDYDGLIDQVFKGYAEPAPNIAGPGRTGIGRGIYASLWKKMGRPERDLERAERLIKEAGAEGKTVSLPTVSDVQYRKAGINTIADGLRRIGLNVKQEAFTSEQYNAILFDPEVREGLDLMFREWPVDVGDPLTIYAYFAMPGGLLNLGEYEDPKVTKLLTEAGATNEDDPRSELVAQAAEQFAKTGPVIPIAYQYTRLYMSNEVAGAPPLYTWTWNPWAIGVGEGKGG